MTIYIILIFIIIILGLGIKPGYSLKRRKEFLIFSFLLLTIISGFREYSVGADTRTYVALFNKIEYVNFSTSRYESGFLYYLKAIRFFTENPTVFLLFSSILCIGITFLFIYYFSDDPLLSVLLYIVLKPYFFQMTGIRQSLATAFIMLSFILILHNRSKKKNILSFAIMILAIEFHYIAIVAFVPYILFVLPKLRNSLKITPTSILKWTIILALGLFILHPLVLRLVSIIFPRYTHYFGGTWGDSNYFASLFNTLIQLSFLVFGYIYLKKHECTEIEKFALLMIFISVITNTLSMRMEIWGRLTGLFSIYTGILFAPMFSSVISKWKNRAMLKSLIFLFSFAYMLVTFIFRPEWDRVVPYLFH